MQSKNMKWLVANAPKFAAASPDNPFLKAVAESIEVGIVVPSILKAKLLESGFAVVADDAEHKKYGYRVLPNNYRVHVIGPLNVHPDHSDENRGLIAAGMAPSEASALVHAALGFVRECVHAEDRAAGKPKRTFGLGDPAALGVQS